MISVFPSLPYYLFLFLSSCVSDLLILGIRLSPRGVFQRWRCFPFRFRIGGSLRGTAGRFIGCPSGSFLLRDEGVTAVLDIRVGYEGEGDATTAKRNY